jgi:hypothetical protein
MPGERSLARILLSVVTTETLFSDDFGAFRKERAELLAATAQALLQ